MRKTILFAAVAAALTAGAVYAAETKSGPQEGEKLPGPFHPLNVTGESAGEKACLYCKNGNNPVAVVFARCGDCEMTKKLVKKLDAVTAKNADKKMGSYVVFCSDEDELDAKLKEMAQKEGIKTTVLAIESAAGPEDYKISKDADVTVLLYVNRTVKANHTFGKEKQLDDKAIEQIVADVAKICPAQ